MVGGDGRALEVFEVQRAAFNQPDHPPRLTPTHIGLEPGMMVDYYTTRGAPSDSLVWDGEKAISAEEFTQRVAAGELEYGARVARALSRYMTLDPKTVSTARAAPRPEGRSADGTRTGDADGQAARGASDAGARGTAPASSPATDASLTFEGRWERYTREFIEQYRLDEEQQQKAWLILRQCQARAKAYLASRESAFERLEKRIAEVEELDAAKRPAVQQELMAEREALFAPVDDIFERQLKPGLEKLPTRAQRQAAEGVSEPGP
jgi:hypothetical protein